MASKKAKAKELQRYRRLYAQAKKMNLLARPKDARKIKPTKYMKTKLNKLDKAGFLDGQFTTVKVGRDVAKAYKAAPTSWTPATFADRVVVPKSIAGSLPKTRGGKIVFIRPLKDGEHEMIPIPIKAVTVENMLDEIKANPIWELSKREDENFAFRIYGNASWETFGNLEAMIQYIETYYPHIEENETNLEDDDESRIPLIIYREKKNWRMASERIDKAARRRVISRKKRRSELSPERRQQLLERDRKRIQIWRQRYPEKYTEQLARRKELARKRKEKMTPEQMARWRERDKIRKQIARENEDEISAELRKLKDRETKREKRNAKKKKKS